jgi:hypothetical protein
MGLIKNQRSVLPRCPHRMARSISPKMDGFHDPFWFPFALYINGFPLRVLTHTYFFDSNDPETAPSALLQIAGSRKSYRLSLLFPMAGGMLRSYDAIA